MNKSEELVYKLCTKSFLSLWSYPNPQGKSGKELCDILVVCEPDVIIFSVKEIEFKDTGRPKIDFDKWRRKAIQESSKQIYGAERWINSNSNVITQNGEIGLSFPNVSNRRIHRIAVALGSQEKVPIHFGDFGKGFIHVLAEKSLDVLMNELDTITDFVKYLTDKEDFFYKGKLTFFSGEEDLLAFYLSQGRTFPEEPSFVVLDDNLWDGFSKMSEVVAKKERDDASYMWDYVIERLCQNYLDNNILPNVTNTPKNLSQFDNAIRYMARENRFSRRHLGKSLIDLLQNSKSKSIKARISDSSISEIRYVFMIGDYDKNRELNFKELEARCLIARGINQEKQTVIGLLIEFSEKQPGDAMTILYLDVPDWTSEWQQQMEYLQKELGYFTKPAMQNLGEDEYPKLD